MAHCGPPAVPTAARAAAPGAASSVAAVEPGISTRQLLRWSESLAAIAKTGLGFTQSLYERERFEEILRVAADIGVAAAAGVDGAGDDAAGSSRSGWTMSARASPAT